MLSIIVPVRNESENLKDVFDYYTKNVKDFKYEVLIVNDFSKDNTLNVARELEQKYKNFKILDNKKKGLGGAINLGIEKAEGDYIAIMMADQSDDINDLKKYFQIISSENLDAVLGSRFLNNSKVENYPIRKLILNRIN